MKKYGRLELASSVDNPQYTIPAILNDICQRCLAQIPKEWMLPNGIKYCWHCAKYGRITEAEKLITYPEPHCFERKVVKSNWSGELTEQQQSLADLILDGIKLKQDQLLFAVTGAGKTEMIYPALTYSLNTGQRIAYVSPRVDVIQEIMPRIQENFDIKCSVMYGDVLDTYDYQQVTFATIHQMYKFYHAFDLILVDEADAFPFANNFSLWYALAQARSDNSCMIYMTATLNKDLRRLIELNQVVSRTLLQRFHGYKLPNFKVKLIDYNWRTNFISDLIEQIITSKKPWLIFVPKVEDLKTCEQLLKNQRLALKIQFLSSQVSNRREIVEHLQQREIDVVFTTIILERGITIPDIQIAIFGVEEGDYSDESLLQIAGRSGRNPDFPSGELIIYCLERTYQMERVINIIHALNVNQIL